MDIRIPAGVGRVLEALEAAGWESYVVGGCVRDSLLGRTPHDWDVCTAAPPKAVEAVFAAERVLEIKNHLNARGINYLLNVGPDYLGRIPAPARAPRGSPGAGYRGSRRDSGRSASVRRHGSRA